MNKAWHAKNKLRRGVLRREGIRWHAAHAENCGCQPIPKSLLREIKKPNK